MENAELSDKQSKPKVKKEEEEEQALQDIVARNIKRYRKAFNYSQQDVAHAIGTSISAVQKWEQGVHKPSLDWLLALSKLYDVSIEAFLEGAPGMDNPIKIKGKGRSKTVR